MEIREAMQTNYAKVERRFKTGIKSKGLVAGEKAKVDAFCVGFVKWAQLRSGAQIEASGEIAKRLIEEIGLDKELAAFVQDAYRECGWDETCEPKYNKPLKDEELSSFLLNYSVAERAAVSPQLVELIMGLLDARAGDTLMNYSCGEGTFLAQALDYQPDIYLAGTNPTQGSAVIARLRSIVAKSVSAGVGVERPATIKHMSVFDDREDSDVYERIVSSHPLGLRMRDISEPSSFVAFMRNGKSSYGCPDSGDWIANCAVIDSLKAGGKGVSLVAPNSTFSTQDEETRRRFIEKGWVQAVIAIPAKSLASVSIPLVLMVLGKEVSEEVIFVNASANQGLSEELVQAILAAMNGEVSELVKAQKVPTAELFGEGCILTPGAWVDPAPTVDNGMEIGALCSIKRGLDPKLAQKPSSKKKEGEPMVEVSVINTVDLADAHITACSSQIEVPVSRAEANSVQVGDVLVSRTGTPTKIAVLTEDAAPMIPCNNLYALRVAGDAIDPWYLAAYLDSESGQEALKRACTGTVAVVLGNKELERIAIPRLEREEEQRIGSTWRQRMERVATLRTELNAAAASVHEGLWG